MTTDAELVRVWREGLQETARRCRAWPAEVRHDAAMESFLAFLEAARRGEEVHKAAPYWVGRKAFRHLTQQRHSGRGYHGRPIASAAMLGPGLGERVAPDEWLAESQAVVADLEEVADLSRTVALDLRKVVRAETERKRKRGSGKAFKSALCKLAGLHGRARVEVAERCGVQVKTVHEWAAGRDRVPPERREHLIWAVGLGPCPGLPPPRMTREVLRPPLVDRASLGAEPLTAVDVARAMELVRAHRATTLAALCGVDHASARQWRHGIRPLPELRARQILASHARGDLPGAP